MYNNFYEFSEKKGQVITLSRNMKTRPWKVEVGGLVNKPLTLDIDDILALDHVPRVVILSGCETARAAAARQGVTVGLAQAFITAINTDRGISISHSGSTHRQTVYKAASTAMVLIMATTSLAAFIFSPVSFRLHYSRATGLTGNHCPYKAGVKIFFNRS